MQPGNHAFTLWWTTTPVRPGTALSRRRAARWRAPRSYEKGSGRFVLGERGAKSKKYVQGAPNLYFGVYQSKGKRSYATIPLAEVIERQKQGLTSVPELNEKGEKLLFSLSPNDLVYVPMESENIENIDFTNLSKEQRERVYKTVSFTGNQCLRNKLSAMSKYAITA